MTTLTKIPIQPLGDCIIVRLSTTEEKTASGLVVPDTAKDKSNEAEVLAVGPGRMTDKGKRVAIDLKPGDRVILQTYAGSEVKLNGEEYLVIRETGILAKIM